ncbi:MAG: excinuclease ABC subunit UvrB [bacterium]|nr:excinuclease ABC subunit UvrB [bacterium]
MKSSFAPQGDQPKAIQSLNQNLKNKNQFQTLLGVTGSGKTFTVANIIKEQARPTLIIAPNKTLAAQLFSEFKSLFPENQVHYFVSYYDYYQPEAFIPSTNTYIEKDSMINEEIDKMRHSATTALLGSRDVIIVASVSCIYGIGAPEEYLNMMLPLKKGQIMPREELLKRLVYLQYERTEIDFKRGSFRVNGEVIDIFPANEDVRAIRLIFFGDLIEEMKWIDSITHTTLKELEVCDVYPASHYVVPRDIVLKAIESVKVELREHLKIIRKANKILEAERLEQRVLYDMELLKEVGFCSGIENYSRHLTTRVAGEPSATLIDYFPDDYLLVIDESHVTIPQINGMHKGDRSRKQTLVDHGFRLPSAIDNRPLNDQEFWARAGQTIFVSATPGDYEIEKSQGKVIEQLIRPTGLLDPEVIIRPATGQVDDLLKEIKETVAKGDRVLVTTLTKKMSEDLSMYLREIGVKAKYLHSDIDTIERVEILRGLRKGDFDVLIGINLLREGLDLPEVSLVAILDGDKEGFLRSRRSLIQTMGRAARNERGRAIIYADVMTTSIREAVGETQRRRVRQEIYNKTHGIIPKSTTRELEPALGESLDLMVAENVTLAGKKIEIPVLRVDQQKLLEHLRREMSSAAQKREFEKAAEIRDVLIEIQKELLK